MGHDILCKYGVTMGKKKEGKKMNPQHHIGVYYLNIK